MPFVRSTGLLMSLGCLVLPARAQPVVIRVTDGEAAPGHGASWRDTTDGCVRIVFAPRRVSAAIVTRTACVAS